MKMGRARWAVLVAGLWLCLWGAWRLHAAIRHGRAVIAEQARYLPAHCQITSLEGVWDTTEPLGFSHYRLTYEYCGTSADAGCRGGLTTYDGFAGLAADPEWEERYRAGEPFTCFYDPQNPGRAVLVKGYTSEHRGALAIWAVVLLLGLGTAALARWLPPAPRDS